MEVGRWREFTSFNWFYLLFKYQYLVSDTWFRCLVFDKFLTILLLKRLTFFQAHSLFIDHQ